MSKDEKQFYKNLRRRLAQTAISSSTFRNYGKGKIDVCRKYFESERLVNEFFLTLTHKKKYKRFLDKHTNLLSKRLSRKNSKKINYWGVARKSLNLFFRDLFYNKYFADRYNIPSAFDEDYRKICNLEIPLDSYVAINLQQWTGIKNLTKETNEIYQANADFIAKKMNIARIHLDLKYWRNKNKNNKQ